MMNHNLQDIIYPIVRDMEINVKTFFHMIHPLLSMAHKVAISHSSYPTIYLDGIIPNNENYGPLLKELPSRQKIEELNRLYNI